MRHIHDGELHAFLDGALDLLPEGRGEEIREHLAECSACRERLQDEGAIRDEAGALLGEPDLSSVSLPSFEELRQLAEAPVPPAGDGAESEAATRTPHRGPLKGLPLAWAATIILALGVGWMGGQVWETLPSQTLPGGPVSAPEGSAVPASTSPDPEAPAPQSETAPPGPARADPEEVDRQSSSDAEGRARPADAVAQPGVAEPDRAEAAVSGEVGPEIQGREAASEVRRLLSEDARAKALVLEEVALPSVADSGGAYPASVTEHRVPAADFRVGRADSTDVAAASMAIPGLVVLSTEWEERVPGERALLIRQQVAPGDTLELRYFGLLLGSHPDPEVSRAAAPSKDLGSVGRVTANALAASLPSGWHQVVMERDRGLVVARGPLPEDDLKSLLKRIR